MDIERKCNDSVVDVDVDKDIDIDVDVDKDVDVDVEKNNDDDNPSLREQLHTLHKFISCGLLIHNSILNS
ncbi:MAG: hypothetical protein AB1478_12155 [Nitrospirota bacterium]|jgi:hypothetical protein